MDKKIDNYNAEFRRLERELVALKTSALASPLVQGYLYKGTASHVGRYRIDFADGNSPIMTENLTYASAMSTPVGNVQYIWVYGQDESAVIFVSNRPILAFEYDPE